MKDSKYINLYSGDFCLAWIPCDMLSGATFKGGLYEIANERNSVIIQNIKRTTAQCRCIITITCEDTPMLLHAELSNRTSLECYKAFLMVKEELAECSGCGIMFWTIKRLNCGGIHYQFCGQLGSITSSDEMIFWVYNNLLKALSELPCKGFSLPINTGKTINPKNINQKISNFYRGSSDFVFAAVSSEVNAAGFIGKMHDPEVPFSPHTISFEELQLLLEMENCHKTGFRLGKFGARNNDSPTLLRRHKDGLLNKTDFRDICLMAKNVSKLSHED